MDFLWSNQESPIQAEMMGHSDSWIKLYSQNTAKASVVVTGPALKVSRCSASLFKYQMKSQRTQPFVTDLHSEYRSTEAEWNKKV